LTSQQHFWSRRLDEAFFRREVHTLAKDLLGRHLCRDDGQSFRVGRIVEVEAYGGAPDPACHGDSGVPTDRTRPMFERGGLAYVYLIYGMYHCFNIVSDPDGIAAAVLVRAAEPVVGLPEMARSRGLGAPTSASTRRNLMSGPGKLCQAMAISREKHDGVVLASPELFVSTGEPVPEEAVVRTPRIGLNPKTVGDAVGWDWRYVDARSEHLSKPV
jgi:DNA-3-methyladenine glycosylase